MEWTKNFKNTGRRIGELSKLAPEAVKGFMALNNSSDKAVHLDAKTRELISLAVAVTTRCDGCIAGHVDAARKLGVSKAEIAEALGVAISLNAGAALVYSTRVLDCFEEMESHAA